MFGLVNYIYVMWVLAALLCVPVSPHDFRVWYCRPIPAP